MPLSRRKIPGANLLNDEANLNRRLSKEYSPRNHSTKVNANVLNGFNESDDDSDIEKSIKHYTESKQKASREVNKLQTEILSLKASNKQLQATNLKLVEKVDEYKESTADYIAMHKEKSSKICELKKKIHELICQVRTAQEEAMFCKNHTPVMIDAVMYDQVCSYVCKQMFRKVKFTIDRTLDATGKGSIGYTVATAFNIQPAQIVPWWNCYKQAAHQGITQSRNGKITEIKNCFKRKYG